MLHMSHRQGSGPEADNVVIECRRVIKGVGLCASTLW